MSANSTHPNIGADLATARGDEDPSIGGTLTTARKFKAGLQGFVAFMKRKDAETAVRELDGLDWGGSVIRVGWSKPVPLPHQPLYRERKVKDLPAR